jgi:Protein of unknown function (DUF2490)
MQSIAYRVSTLLALLLLAPCLAAQQLEEDVGAWFTFAGNGHFKTEGEPTKWTWWAEAQMRFYDNSNGFDEGTLRPGLGYSLSKSSTLWLGYAWVHSDPEGVRGFDEGRIWEQFSWKTPLGEGTFDTRSRLEQRWVETGDDLGWRFRQMIRYVLPFEKGSRWAVRIFDEAFFALNDTDWGADAGLAENQIFLGLGWTFDTARIWTFEAGYMNQWKPKSSSPDIMNHVLFVQLHWNP